MRTVVLRYLFTFFVFALSWSLSSCAPKESKDLNWSYTGSLPCYEDRSPFGGGQGTEADPYRICTKNHFQNIASNSGDKFFKLHNNIDLKGSAASPTQMQSAFKSNSTLDGNGYTVSNIYINNTTSSDVGIFSNLESNSTIKNIKVSGINNCNYACGIIAGSVTGTTNLENISINATTNYWGSANGVGGLIGINYSSLTIQNSSASLKIYSMLTGVLVNYIGGFVGYNDSSELHILNSNSNLIYYGDMPTTMGGLIGQSIAASNTVEIINSASTVDLRNANSPNDNIGGLIGYTDSVIITNSSSEGYIYGDWKVGGLIGYSENATISNCHVSNITIGGTSYVGGFVGQGVSNSISGANSSSYANVTIKSNSNAINFGGIVGYASGTFQISNTTSSGTIVDNGHTTLSNANYVGGLIGYSNATLEVSNSSSSISFDPISGDFFGGLIGEYDHYDTLSTAAITRSHYSGTIGDAISTANNIGGIVGSWNSNQNIFESYANISIYSKGNKLGGIAGSVIGNDNADLTTYATLTKVKATGTINNTKTGNQIGGLIGNATSVYILSSYSDMILFANDILGGIIGKITSAATGSNNSKTTIEASYSKSTLNATTALLGGFVATENLASGASNTTILYSFWLNYDNILSDYIMPSYNLSDTDFKDMTNFQFASPHHWHDNYGWTLQNGSYPSLGF